ncbi:MAG: SDR family oxidoreductase [Anaerolineae bacterium]|nr:SDR family oxidoreductase [Anaerolineae bacterium]
MTAFEGTVLVLGANGETGRRVVKNLHNKRIQVRAMVRAEDRIHSTPELSLHGVETIIGSVLSMDDLRRAMRGIRAVISALGARFHYTQEEIEAVEALAPSYYIAVARESGVEQIVMCSSLSTETPERIPQLAPILVQKRRGELAVINSGIPYTIVRPGGLTNAPASHQVLVARKLDRSGMISREDVAEVLVQALLQPEARNKIVEIIAQEGAGAADREKLFVLSAN